MKVFLEPDSNMSFLDFPLPINERVSPTPSFGYLMLMRELFYLGTKHLSYSKGDT